MASPSAKGLVRSNNLAGLCQKHSPTQLGCELKRKGSQGTKKGTEEKGDRGAPREGVTDILKQRPDSEKDHKTVW